MTSPLLTLRFRLLRPYSLAPTMLGSRGLRVGSPAFLCVWQVDHVTLRKLTPTHRRPLTLQALSAQRGLSQSTRRALPLPTKIVKGPVHDRRVQLLAHRVPAEREIDLKQIMDDLRDLELLDVLNKVSPKCRSQPLQPSSFIKC